jgi:hypothetical protein
MSDPTQKDFERIHRFCQAQISAAFPKATVFILFPTPEIYAPLRDAFFRLGAELQGVSPFSEQFLKVASLLDQKLQQESTDV